jgi:hypothetical protein
VQRPVGCCHATHGWQLSEAYREESRKLRALPSDLPGPALLWTVDDDIARMRWVILCFEYIDGAPPRRPWQPDELRLVIDALAQLAPLVARRRAARESLTRCAGTAVAQLDLRDDNILIGRGGRVSICDWNWPLLGAPPGSTWSPSCSRSPGMAWMPMRCSRPIP